MRHTSNRWDCGDEKGDEVLHTKVDREDQWQIECDAEALMKAREIALDEGRLEKVKEYFKKQGEAITDLTKDDFYEKLIGLR